METDGQLLRRFVEERAEPAFTELVRRHLDLVYSAALRRVGGDAHRAADVTQQVFIALARQAPQLVQHTMLSAWLHSATRNVAINAMVVEQRRRAREIAAVALTSGQVDEPAVTWEQVRPLLDLAIDELPTADRTAVVLRFLEQRPFAEIGALLNLSTDAARMRTDRALVKLRGTLARHGITSTTAALGTLVSAHASEAAPAGLAASVAPAALAATAGASTAAMAVTTFLMSTKTIVTAATVVAALGLGFYAGQARYAEQPLAPPPPTPEHLRAIAALRTENERLQAETERLSAANAALASAAARPAESATPPARPAAPAPLPAAPLPAVVRVNQQRTIINNLRMISAARDRFLREYNRAPLSVEELVGPTKYIRALNPVAGESYAAVALDSKQPLTVSGPDGRPLTYDPAGSGTTSLERESIAANEEAMNLLTARFGAEFVLRMQTSIQKAMAAYSAANGGKRPATPAAALPYFPTPQDGADFVEFSEAAKALGMKF